MSWKNFLQYIEQPESKIDLATASLYYAQAEYPQLDLDKYLNFLEEIASEIKTQIPAELYPLKVIKTINQYLFTELGFHGNSEDYYDPLNSYLNQVIERRRGIPITLSVIYLAIAKRIGFPMVGIGMPEHFIIRPEFAEVGIFVDPFNQGEIMFKEDCLVMLTEIYPEPITLQPQFFEPVSKRQILARMLNNLKFIYAEQGNLAKVLDMIHALLSLIPNNPLEIRFRGLIYYQLQQYSLATKDLKYYLEILPQAQDASAIRFLLAQINLNQK